MNEIVATTNCTFHTGSANSFLPLRPYELDSSPLEDHLLHTQQLALSTILETAVDYRQAQTLLQSSGLANSAWEIEKWDLSMIETALAIAQKWKSGFS